MPRIKSLTLNTARVLKKDDAAIASFFKKHAADYVQMLDELQRYRAAGDDGVLVQCIALGMHGLVASLGDPNLMRAALAECFEEHIVPFVRETGGLTVASKFIDGVIDDLNHCRTGGNGPPVAN